MISRLLVGIDISKGWFDACFSVDKTNEVARYSNDAKGFEAFRERVQTFGKRKVWVCMEHTGGYEKALALACREAKLRVSIVDGATVAHYKKSIKAVMAKTDAIDARVLARFCFERQPDVWFPLPDPYLELKEIVKLRDDLVEKLKICKQQAAHASRLRFVAQARRTLVEVLQMQLKETEKQIKALLEVHPELKKQVRLLQSIPGIAKTSATKILAETGPIENYDTARDYALAAGLVPIVCHSGAKTPPGKLPVYGNRRLRTALYMPTITNRRLETGIKPFMDRIEKNGPKRKMTVVVAGMRKLAHVVYGVLKHQSKFSQEIAMKTP